MKKTTLVLAVLVGFSITSYTQKATYIASEVSVSNDLYDIIDPCNIIKPTPLVTGSWGFLLGQQINESFAIEIGFIRKYYADGFGFTSQPNAGVSSNAFNSWQIPLRLRARINLVKHKFYLTTTIGYHLGINSEYGYGGGSGGAGLVDGNDSISVFYTINDSLAKTFSLLEAGIGLELIVFNGFSLYLSSSYYMGLNRVYQLDMKTEDTDCSTENALAISKGGYWNIAFGVKYAISNLWRKKE